MHHFCDALGDEKSVLSLMESLATFIDSGSNDEMLLQSLRDREQLWVEKVRSHFLLSLFE